MITPREQLSVADIEFLDMTRAGARALWTLADSKHNMEQMRKSGIVPLMSKLLKSIHIDVVIPIMGTVRKCSSQPKFQLAITTEGMIADIVKYLKMDNIDLKVECSAALYQCATDRVARDQIREADGLQPLIAIIKDKTIRDNKPLLRGTTGAIWMCATTDANIKDMEDYNVMNHLVNLLNDDCDEVLTNVAGAISECVRLSENRTAVRNAGGLPLMVALLNSSHAPLLENLAMAIKECAEDHECMRELEQNDAVRLVWSLLKNTSPRVQAKAAYAICPCVKNATDSAELVRSLVGAMELVVGLLKSKEIMVLSAVCSAISTIALDQTNLAILTDLRVIYKLSDLVNTTDDNLRLYLAAAVAACACYGTNTEEFGRLRTVTPIVTFMTSENPNVHRTTAMALEKLSMDPQNCITMHQVRKYFTSVPLFTSFLLFPQSGVVPFLLECIGSTNKELQLAAAGCLRNIRELALRAEEYMLKIDDD